MVSGLNMPPTAGRLTTVKETGLLLAISLLAVLIYLALFYLRALDDNSLTSWRLVFGVVDPWRVLPALVLCLPVAWFLSGFPLPGPVLLFFISFLVCVLFWREPEVIVDASRYFTQAKHLEVYGVGYFLREWGRDIGAWTDMPLASFLYGMVFRYAGESRVLLQALVAAMFSMSAVLAGLIGRELWDGRVGDTGGALLLGMPYLLTQTPLMLVDLPAMFFLTLAVYLFLMALRHGGAVLVLLSSAAVSLAVFSKYSLWPMLSVLGVVFLLRLREDGRDVVRRGALVALFTVVFTGIPLICFHDVVSGQIRLLLEYQRPGLGRWSEGFVSTLLFQIHPFLTAGALYSVYRAVRKRDLKYLAIGWLVLLMAVMQVKRIRYLLPVFPMLALMSSYGLCAIGMERVRRFVVCVVVSSSVALGVFAFLPFLERNELMNLMDAGRFLDTLDFREARVLTLPQRSAVNPAVSVPLLDLYTGKRLLYDYDPIVPLTGKEVERSPLRFTWEYKNPRYYEAPDEGGAELLVVVSDGGSGVEESSIEGYGLIKKFNVSGGLYRFRPFVGIYQARRRSLSLMDGL